MSSNPADLDAIIGESLRIMTQAVGDICQRSTLREASDGTLNANQFAMLRILSQHDDATASEFARLLAISNAAISKNIDRLAAMGLVARGVHPSDRRSMSLVLQPAGRELLERFDRIADRKVSGILAQFSADEKTRLLDYIQRIVRFTLSDEQDVDAICYQCGGRCGDNCILEDRAGSCSLKRTGGN